MFEYVIKTMIILMKKIYLIFRNGQVNQNVDLQMSLFVKKKKKTLNTFSYK